MLLKAKVYSDGNHFIANLPMASLHSHSGHAKSDARKLFDTYYAEACEKGISKKEIVSYIEDRNREENDIEDWFIDDQALRFYKQTLNAHHKRIKRYERKVYLNTWNYFVTFTYDDKKETPESFSARLRKALSNLSSRCKWKYIGAEEHGELKGRLHYHFIVNVPPGAMVGKLFLDYKRSKKHGKMKYFTNNTYFQDRFGQSVWEVITDEDMRTGKVRGYLLKYLQKSGTKLIYSRGVPGEIEVEIDTERDVVCTFQQYTMKCILKPFFFGDFSSVIDDSPYNFRIFYNEYKAFDLGTSIRIG